MSVFYNENEPFAANWLENLANAEQIPHGVVDRRSIEDLAPEDCADTSHFFAGIGGWPYALKLAGWPEDRPVWTGSCPCQPFSQAGRRKGFADKRHLWPAWFRLIRECRPPTIFGEQVASSDALRWVDSVFDDLEGSGYACGAAILPACGVGAPHIRQRLYWVAFSSEQRREGERLRLQPRQSREAIAEAIGRGSDGRLGYANRTGSPVGSVPVGRQGDIRDQRQTAGAPSVDFSPWAEVEWLSGEDGKARPIKPGLSPLASGVSGRVAVVRPREQPEASVQETHWYSRSGALKCYGNAIVPQVAAAFVRAVL